MAKKISLREFQESLAARLKSAARGQTTRALLGVQVGTQHWLLDLTDSGEIVPLPPLAPVPLTRPWYVGLANIRGNLYSVADFSAFLGNEATPHNPSSRLLLIGARHGSNAALLVTRMLGLKAIDTLTPVAHEGDSRWSNAAYTDTEGRHWKKLDVRTLIDAPEFNEIGA